MIIITGNRGFVGSRVFPLIRKRFKGEKIILLDKPKYNLVTGKNLDKLPSSPKLIIHLAAATDTAKRDHRANDVGTKNLINSLKNLGPKTHFIYTSSLAVYSGRKNCKKPISSKTPTEVSNEYGKTKLAAEKILLEASRVRGFKLTIVRFPTVWGDNPRKNSFLNFLRSLVKNNSIFSRIDWPGKTGMISVDDAAKYILGLTRGHPVNKRIVSIAAENLTLSQIFEKLYVQEGKKYTQTILPNFIWDLARFLRPYLKYFEFLLPVTIYNYFWRASIVVDSPLRCNVNASGKKFSAG